MGKQSRERREKFAKLQEAREIEGLVKRARFYDRVKRKSGVLFDELSCEVVDLQLVDTLTTQGFAVSHFVPIKPPFTDLWLEWNDGGGMVGVLVSDESASPPSNRIGISPDGNEVAMLVYVELADEIELIAFPSIIVNECFEPQTFKITYHQKSKMYQGIAKRGDLLSELKEVLDWHVMLVVYALQLLNCKNITLMQNYPDPADSASHEHLFGVPLTKYKTLAIKSMSQRADSDKPQQQFDIMPLHLRRGNFAHYTDDAPLFGKYTGTFWRPATVVGSEKNGVVVKDYKVLAPEEN